MGRKPAITVPGQKLGSTAGRAGSRAGTYRPASTPIIGYLSTPARKPEVEGIFGRLIAQRIASVLTGVSLVIQRRPLR
jgi:hypothetical protein